MSTEIVHTDERRSLKCEMADRFKIDADKIVPLLRATVIKPDKNGRVPTNEEVYVFMSVAVEYNLNPFTKQIYAFVDPHKGCVVPIVPIDGWAAIVNRQERFDGCQFEETHNANGELVSTSCTMHVKDRSVPVTVTEYYEECKRPTTPWVMKHRMLRHKAFMQAARLAFSISGIYDEDEARDIVANVPAVEVKSRPVAGTQRVRDALRKNVGEPKQLPSQQESTATRERPMPDLEEDLPPPEPDAPTPQAVSDEPPTEQPTETPTEPVAEAEQAAPLWTLADLSNAQDGDWARTGGIVEKVEAKGTAEKPFKVLHLWGGSAARQFSVWDKSADAVPVGKRVELIWKAKAKAGRMYYNAESVQVAE